MQLQRGSSRVFLDEAARDADVEDMDVAEVGSGGLVAETGFRSDEGAGVMSLDRGIGRPACVAVEAAGKIDSETVSAGGVDGADCGGEWFAGWTAGACPQESIDDPLAPMEFPLDGGWSGALGEIDNR
jgi:hypothetical protein